MIATLLSKLLAEFVIDPEKNFDDNYGVIFNFILYVLDNAYDIIYKVICWVLARLISLFSQLFGFILNTFFDILSNGYSSIVVGGKAFLNHIFYFSTFDSGTFSNDFLFFFVGLLCVPIVIRLIVKLVFDILHMIF